MAEKAAWFNCFAGIAGDMALGALLDAGADLEEVRRLLERLPLTGWSLEARPVMRAGLAATQAVVEVREDQVVRTHAHVVGIIEEARLPERVRDRALAAFGALAHAEAKLHRRPVSQVHFHEVGGQDAIVDVVGVASALEVLGVDVVYASPIALGSGVLRSAHGVLPNPAPAVVELLRGVPTFGSDIASELTTPTGAALVATLAADYGAQPRMVVETAGYGAGERELDLVPNAVQVIVGRLETRTLPEAQEMALVETNVDDATGEVLARTLAAALDAGAADAWVTPVVMKKGRPGHVVSVLVDRARLDRIVPLVRKETGSLGIRATFLSRWPAARRLHTVEVEGYPVRIKLSPGRIKAEHDDALRVASRTGLPLREVLRRAESKAAEEIEAEEKPRRSPPPGTVA